MQYALTIYDDQSKWADAPPDAPRATAGGVRPRDRPEMAPARRASTAPARGSSPSPPRRRCVCPTASAWSPTAHSRRRRSSWPASTPRVREPRRGDRVGGEDPRRAERHGRGAPGDRDHDAGSGGRPPVPARVGAGDRHAHPGARRLRRRRGGGAGGVGRALERWPATAPAQPRRVDHGDRAQPGDRPAAAGARARGGAPASSRRSPTSRRGASPTTGCG